MDMASEMMGDAVDDALDDDEVEDETDDLMNQVCFNSLYFCSACLIQSPAVLALFLAPLSQEIWTARCWRPSKVLLACRCWMKLELTYTHRWRLHPKISLQDHNKKQTQRRKTKKLMIL